MSEDVKIAGKSYSSGYYRHQASTKPTPKTPQRLKLAAPLRDLGADLVHRPVDNFTISVSITVSPAALGVLGGM